LSTTIENLEQKCSAEAARMDFSRIVDALQNILGTKLVAYIASVQDTRTVRAWASGTPVKNDERVARLRLAYEIALCMDKIEGHATTQAWFQGLNPLLGDARPARLLREGDLDTDGPRVREAERAFLAHG
jgi:hypothetical protein